MPGATVHVVGGCVRQWWREARRRMWWRTHGMGWNAGYVWCCCSSLAIRIVGNTLTHTYTHTQILGTRTQYGTYTQWSVDCQWQVHTVERGEGGGAHGHTLWQFQWLEHGLYARHTDTQTDCFKAHVDSIYL